MGRKEFHIKFYSNRGTKLIQRRIKFYIQVEGKKKRKGAGITYILGGVVHPKPLPFLLPLFGCSYCPSLSLISLSLSSRLALSLYLQFTLFVSLSHTPSPPSHFRSLSPSPPRNPSLVSLSHISLSFSWPSEPCLSLSLYAPFTPGLEDLGFAHLIYHYASSGE